MDGYTSTAKEEEIIGGLRNALNRGETVDLAKISFLNAGYSPQLISLAVRKIMGENVPVMNQQPQNINLPPSTLNLYAMQQRPQNMQSAVFNQPPVNRTPQKTRLVPYWAIVLMLLFSLLIMIGAGVLVLYWGKLFG